MNLCQLYLIYLQSMTPSFFSEEKETSPICQFVLEEEHTREAIPKIIEEDKDKKELGSTE